MKVKFNINQNFFINLNNISYLALDDTADALKTDLQESGTVPAKTLYLQNSSISTKRQRYKAIIKMDAPYARRLYFHPEYNFSKKINKKARGMWFEPYINGRKKTLPKRLYIKFIRKRLT